MTCPRCKCEECRRVELQAVLGRHVARETFGIGPAITQLPIIEAANRETLQQIQERAAWGDTWPDPVADKLAADVLATVDEYQRGAA